MGVIKMRAPTPSSGGSRADSGLRIHGSVATWTSYPHSLSLSLPIVETYRDSVQCGLEGHAGVAASANVLCEQADIDGRPMARPAASGQNSAEDGHHTGVVPCLRWCYSPAPSSPAPQSGHSPSTIVTCASHSGQ